MQQRASYTMAGFLVMAFAVVGLTGFMAAQLAPLPLQRAIAREAVLDEALSAAAGPDAAAALEAMRPRLGDSAAALLPVTADIAGRIAAERLAMRVRRMAEADATGRRLQVMVVVVTVLAAGFAAVMMLAGRR